MEIELNFDSGNLKSLEPINAATPSSTSISVIELQQSTTILTAGGVSDSLSGIGIGRTSECSEKDRILDENMKIMKIDQTVTAGIDDGGGADNGEETKVYYELKPVEAPHVVYRRIGCCYDDFCIEELISEKTILDYDHEIETSSLDYYSYEEPENSADEEDNTDHHWDEISKWIERDSRGNGFGSSGLRLHKVRYNSSVSNDESNDDDLPDEPYQCSKCDETFKRSRALYTHLHQVHGHEMNYKCFTCNENFETPNSMIAHMKRHKDIKRPYVCNDCGKKFKTFDYLESHRTNKMCNTTQSICAVCGKEFKNQFNLIRHRSVHTNDRPFKCSICGKTFKQQDNLSIHVRCHKTDKPFKCDKCPKRFKDEQYFGRHKKMHDSDFLFHCTVCRKPFRLLIHLEKHMRIHTKEGKAKFNCPQCEKVFRTEEKLNRHMNKHLLNNDAIKCRICAKEFPNTGYLMRHMVTHQNEAKYNENDVDSGHNSSSTNGNNNTNNNNNNNNNSSSSSSSNNDNNNLSQSVNNNVNDINYLSHSSKKCGVCGMTFTTSAALYKHIERHKDNRPYKCEICFKKFKTAGYLKKHQRHFHAEFIVDDEIILQTNEDTMDEALHGVDDSLNLVTSNSSIV